MKKFGFLALLLFLLVLVLPGTGYANAGETHINLDGNDLQISKEAQVQNVNGNIMVPLRVVTEQLGFTVKWDNTSKSAVIEQKGTTLKLTVGHTVAEVSGKQVKLDNPPFLSGSTTLVPLRFIGEQTGTTVGWDNVTKTVYLTTLAPEIGGSAPEVTVPEVTTPDPSVTTPSENGSSGNTDHAGIGSIAAITNLSFIDNQLIIAVNGTVTPTVFSMTNKDRIVIDLPNTSFGDSFHQNLSLGQNQSGQLTVTEYPNVSAVRYSLFSHSPSTIRIVIDLNSANSYNVINDNDGLIIVDLNGTSITPPDITTPEDPVTTPPATTGNTDKKIIVLDAGHGGKDPGSSSINKRKEKDFTLPTTLKIADLLRKEPNIEVVLTRSGDTYPTLQERSKLANNVNADLFISIHADSITAGSKSNPSGTGTFYTRKESLLFAQTVQKYLVAATGLTDRGVRQENYHVTRETKMPAILLECGFLSNVKDEALLYTDDVQNKIAEAVVTGIKEYLGR